MRRVSPPPGMKGIGPSDCGGAPGCWETGDVYSGMGNRDMGARDVFSQDDEFGGRM
jgi:hypothetical protein